MKTKALVIIIILATVSLVPRVMASINATNTDPGDFFSTFTFVMNADDLMFVLLSMWVIGLSFMMGKICFGSYFGLFFGSIEAAYHGESQAQYRGRAMQAYKGTGAFFAGLFLVALWLGLPQSRSVPAGAIGFTFFLALWLFQVNTRNNRSRSEVSIKNRILGVAGIVFAIIFTILFIPPLFFNFVPMTHHLGLLYSSGWWSILITTLSIIGFVLTVLMLLRLYTRSFTLTVHGSNQETYLPEPGENVHIDYPDGVTPHIRGDSDKATCTLCSHNVKRQGGGWYCPRCYYTVCKHCVLQKGMIMAAWNLARAR